MAKSLVIVGRLGVLGSEPLGFYDKLGAHLGADQYVPADIHADLFGPTGRNSAQCAARVDSIMHQLTTASLQRGVSVIFDAFVNKPEKREALVGLAQRLGATAVLIHTRAPMGVVDSRIRTRHATNQLYVPSEEVSVDSQITIARGMRQYVESPAINPDRNNLPHLCVDGTRSVADLIQEVDVYI